MSLYVQGEDHQACHQHEADLEAELLQLIVHGLAANHLHSIIEKMTAIEERNREEVQHSDRNRQNCGKVEQRRKADLGHRPGHLGDPDRSRQLMGWTCLPGHQAFKIAAGSRHDIPGLRPRKLNQIDKTIVLDMPIFRLAFGLDAKDTDPRGAKRGYHVAPTRRRDELHQFAAAIDAENQLRVAGGLHDALHVLEAIDFDPADRNDPIALLKPGRLGGASGGHAIHHGQQDAAPVHIKDAR